MSNKDILIIDGFQGEGGGQILRTSLTLAAILGRPIQIKRIRAGRARPGLAAQHLTCVQALAEITKASVSGAEIGSMELEFIPPRLARGGKCNFNVALARAGGSAGSCGLIFQSVLLPLAFAKNKSEVTLLGGTHVPWSPTFDFLSQTFLPALGACGLQTSLDLRRPGFYPQGGGRMKAQITPLQKIQALKLQKPGTLQEIKSLITISDLSFSIAARIESQVSKLLKPLKVEIVFARMEAKAHSPGVALFLQARYERGFTGFSAIGEKGKSSEQVAAEAVEALLLHHKSQATIDVRLADQLLLPLAFASGTSVFTTARMSSHLQTNAFVIEQFGLGKIKIQEEEDKTIVTVKPNAPPFS